MAMPDNETKRPTFSISIFHATIALALFVASFLLGGYGFYIGGFHRAQPQVVAMPAASSMQAEGGPSFDYNAAAGPQLQSGRTIQKSAQPANLHFISPANRGSVAERLLWRGPTRIEAAPDDDDTHTPDRLVILAIGLDTPVLDIGWHEVTDRRKRTYRSWEVADDAAGWHMNSDQLGASGNVVFSGHNNMRGSVFRNLNELEVGDMATVWSGDRRYVYKIDEKVILRERGMSMKKRRENAQWIGDFDDDRITLVSCWPRSSNSHRIIVVGHIVDNIDRA